MRNRTKVKLFLGRCHYATIYLDEIKNLEQNDSYWFIEMKNGDYWEDADHLVFTNEDVPVGYFVKDPE
jgi:hypothetical protein